jgi:hypothetical protein
MVREARKVSSQPRQELKKNAENLVRMFENYRVRTIN